MSCKITKSKLSGELTCPANKSYSHRAVFVATLAQGQSKIENILISEDTNVTIQACSNFGASINKKGLMLKVVNKNDTIQAVNIDAANSGTTIRIGAAIAALNAKKSFLTGDSSLQTRPMQPLLDALESMGAKCTSTNGRPPVTISGKILGGKIDILGDISSQFITALMLVAPLTKKGITLCINGKTVSKSYIDATIAIMKKFGASVKIIKQYRKYVIPSQKYIATDFTVPSDFSSLALLLSAAVLVGKNLSIKVAFGDLPQGDKAFFGILEKQGVNIMINDDIITIESPKLLSGGSFDLCNTPDLLPPLAILALKSKNPIDIFNVKHARFKETDRIKILCRELKKTGLKINEKKDGMILERSDKITRVDFDSENDHRLFMAFCVASLYIGECTVSDEQAVAVSYPNFITDINKVGGKITPYIQAR